MSRFIKLAAPVAAAGAAYYYFSLQLASVPPTPALKGDGQWVDFKVASIKKLSEDTKLLTFALPEANNNLGLTTASCVLAKFVTPKGSNVVRPYTPVSDINEKGQFEVLVKKYENGKMSNHIHSLNVNDTLSFKGPNLKWKWEPNQFREIALIAGGTGIAPMYQLIREILKNSNDKTKITLLYGSKTPGDILLKKELELLAGGHAEQFSIQYFVDSKGQNVDFKATEGYITKDVLESSLPKPSTDSHIFVCGPPPLYKAISGDKVSPSDQGEVTGLLKELGYDKTTVFKF